MYTKSNMNTLYRHFGEEKKEDQEMYSVANIFYEMGNSKDNTGDRDNENTLFRLQK